MVSVSGPYNTGLALLNCKDVIFALLKFTMVGQMICERRSDLRVKKEAVFGFNNK
jgi:hypothetical protein